MCARRDSRQLLLFEFVAARPVDPPVQFWEQQFDAGREEPLQGQLPRAVVIGLFHGTSMVEQKLAGGQHRPEEVFQGGLRVFLFVLQVLHEFRTFVFARFYAPVSRAMAAEGRNAMRISAALTTPVAS